MELAARPVVGVAADLTDQAIDDVVDPFGLIFVAASLPDRISGFAQPGLD